MKVYNYSFLMIGMVLLFEMAGVRTGASSLLDIFGIGTDTFTFSTSNLWNAVLGSTGILIGIGAGILIGTMTRSSPENFIILPFIVGTLGLFIQSFGSILVWIIGQDLGWVKSILILILAPFTVMYVFALIEFFRGTD